nr:efflux RND transporter periplasmic adaptor subunit [Gammaproteobacteria bacterium]
MTTNKELPLSLSLSFIAILLTACYQTETDTTKAKLEQIRPAKIVPVVSTDVSLLRTYPGTLEASEQAELAFRVGGQLIDLPAQAGLRVKQGDLLARLDEAEYRNTLEERLARYDLAETEFDQASKLLKKKLTSQLQYDKTKAELKSARAALDQASDNLQYTSLVAPFDGIVARVDVENFQAIQAKVPIIQLQNDESLDVRFSVPESMISQMKRIDDPEVIEGICSVTSFASQPNKSYKACYKEHESLPDP